MRLVALFIIKSGFDCIKIFLFNTNTSTLFGVLCVASIELIFYELKQPPDLEWRNGELYVRLSVYFFVLICIAWEREKITDLG